MRALMRTQNDAGMFFLRLGLGISMFVHGATKVGIFEFPGMASGIEDTVNSMKATFGFDAWMVYCAIAAEFLGSIALVLGFLGRIAALGIGITMGVAAWKTGLQAAFEGPSNQLWDTFRMWWNGDGTYHILAVFASLAILFRGSGALSVDRSLSGSY